MQNKIDFEIARVISEIVGQRVCGREDAYDVGLASLCTCVVSALHQFGDHMKFVETITLINNLYYRQNVISRQYYRRAHKPKERRLH